VNIQRVLVVVLVLAGLGWWGFNTRAQAAAHSDFCTALSENRAKQAADVRASVAGSRTVDAVPSDGDDYQADLCSDVNIHVEPHWHVRPEITDEEIDQAYDDFVFEQKQNTSSGG
jgi:hypothetical protein